MTGSTVSLGAAVASAGGFLLDFDGVLADSEPLYYLSYSEALRPAGLAIEPQEYWLYWTSKGEGLEGYLNRRGIEGVDTAGIRSRQKEIYSGFCLEGRVPLFDGAVQLLDALSAGGRPFAIASNTDRVLVESILGRCGARIPRVIGGDGLPPKPDPAIFLRAAEQLGLAPAGSLVLEDAEKGLRAARAGGFPAVLVRNSLNADMQLEADWEIDGLRRFLGILGGEER
jgi:HAD superfamily hydrolase (TIGR01509 family)